MVNLKLTRPSLLLSGFTLFVFVGRSFLLAGEDTKDTQPVAQATSQAADGDGDYGKKGWLTLGADLRGRLETNTGINFVPGLDDTYYLSRLRLNVSIKAKEWLGFFFQVQDSRAPGYSRQPVPGNVEDPLDFHQGYIELGRTARTRWAFRVGRQEMVFGNGRLIGNSNWGNVGRIFDAARLTYKKDGMQVDWFTSAPVVTLNGSFDEPHFNNKFHGCYASFHNIPFRHVTEEFEAYVLLKTNSRARSELGPVGDLDLYTYGTRLNGKLPHDFDYRFELPIQTGHRSSDHVRAWALHGQFGYRPPLLDKPVRLAAEYNFASGDSNPRDGRDGTFDQLYPTSHDKLGTLDRIGWRNIHDLAGKMDWKLSRKWSFDIEYHDFRLATVQDALYAKDGTPVVRNPHATSSRVGGEVDVYVVFRQSRHLEFGSGFAHMFAGEFLKQSTGVGGASYPYLMWRYRL